MAECSTELKRMVPLYKVVMAAITDSFEDIGKVEHRFSHWATRKLKQLDRQSLKTTKRSVTLTVNRSTNTATLPADFDQESYVGVIVGGKRIPLKLRPEIVDSKNVEDIPCDDTKCPKCAQDTNICNDLTITEDTVLVTIHDSVYEQTTTKKLYPDGSYYLETRIPVWDEAEETVIYTTTKQFIAALDLKPCGCIDDTPQNIETIKCCCPDVWAQYYAPCDNSCTTDFGGYRIFEKTGLIQFDKADQFSKAYMEYYGFLTKKNGHYQVPEVAFETLVKWVQFMNVDGKKNVPNIDKQWRLSRYEVERKAMDKEKGRISISQIIQAAESIPKFDIGESLYDMACGGSVTTTSGSSTIPVVAATPACDAAAVTQSCATQTKGLMPFQIAIIAGMGSGTPTPGTNSYQLDALKGALNLNIISVNNNNETSLAGQFTFDSVSGTIYRYQGDGSTPNLWFAGDILIANFSKMI